MKIKDGKKNNKANRTSFFGIGKIVFVIVVGHFK